MDSPASIGYKTDICTETHLKSELLFFVVFLGVFVRPYLVEDEGPSCPL